jgi:predicted phage terminase large subunit-like protein
MEHNELLSALEDNLDNMSEEERGKVLKFLHIQRINGAKDDFYLFLRLIAPLILPEKFRDGKHLHLFCNELEKLEKAVVRGEKYKLQFFLPPGAMKTLTLCLFVAWCLGRHPKWYILHIGHTAKFAAETFGQRIRDLLLLPEYKEIFPDTKLSKTTRSKDTWQTTEGGTYAAYGAGNPIAGKRGRIVICDDVLSEQTAISKTERTKINNWYVPGLRSRMLPTGSAEIIVNTRWHLDDLSGHMVELDKNAKQKDWRIISIPAILDEAGAKLLGYEVGESFWPEFQPLDYLMEKKATNSPQMWNALYMQNPVPEEGNIFKKKHFQLWDTVKQGVPKVDYVIVSFDTAFSVKDSADYSAYGIWGIFRKNNYNGMFLLHAGKGRWTYPELSHQIKEKMAYWDAQYAIIENKASGQSLIQDLEYQGIPVVPYQPEKDKETRANACVPFCEAGLVWVPEHEQWSRDFVTECMQFPSGQYDDQVDQFTQAVLWMRDNNQLKRPDYATIYHDDDDNTPRDKPKTYWRATMERR